MQDNIQAEIDELKATIAKLEAKQKTQEEPMFKRVGDDEVYYALSAEFAPFEMYENDDFNDEKLHKAANYFTDETVAKRASAFMKDRFWFIHKAIEFAEGYEFAKGWFNYSVVWNNTINRWDYSSIQTVEHPTVIYMNREQADKFIKWLERYKPEGL